MTNNSPNIRKARQYTVVKPTINTRKIQSGINDTLASISGRTQNASMVDYLRTHAIGWAAGYRSTSPYTALAWTSTTEQTPLPASLLDKPAAKAVTIVASIGEAIADKLPATPSRLMPPSFIVRLISGGLAGTIMAQRTGRIPWIGALLGSAGAGLGSVAGYYSRQLLDQHTPIPDPVWGVMEDALALGLGFMASL